MKPPQLRKSARTEGDGIRCRRRFPSRCRIGKNRIGNCRTSRYEAAMFLEELGLPEAGLTKLIHASYALLGLINFFTAGCDEVRAWTIVKGTRAKKRQVKFIRT